MQGGNLVIVVVVNASRGGPFGEVFELRLVVVGETFADCLTYAEFLHTVA